MCHFFNTSLSKLQVQEILWIPALISHEIWCSLHLSHSYRQTKFDYLTNMTGTLFLSLLNTLKNPLQCRVKK